MCLQGLSTALAVRDSLALSRVRMLVGHGDEGPIGLASIVKASMHSVQRMQHILFLQSLLHQLPQLIPQASRPCFPPSACL